MNVWQAKTGCNRRNGFKTLLAFAIDLRCKSLRVLALRCQLLLCAANCCSALPIVALRCFWLLCAAFCCSALPIVALRGESLRCRSCRRVRLSAARFSLHNSCCCQVGAAHNGYKAAQMDRLKSAHIGQERVALSCQFNDLQTQLS